jgi:hypothetical protein
MVLEGGMSCRKISLGKGKKNSENQTRPAKCPFFAPFLIFAKGLSRILSRILDSYRKVKD